ncbi:GGDEF domain-containing protein [Aeromonas schubertii]|uniref:GGDEF domain-containing protein n=1 Tax=Aeromonas schubertii TaxID=652 RepID=UPI000A6A21D5|nr:sensor domain-containing diguanylate cyclase [Aeromonas schubertii]MBZ6073705.1 diguanylate cyclase [Aeromonas schubertii]
MTEGSEWLTLAQVEEDELRQLRQAVRQLEQENRILQERLNAALDGTGLCLWQGLIPTGELKVFNLQHFKAGEMAPHFDQWRAKLHPEDSELALTRYFDHLSGETPFYEAEYRTLAPDGRVTWLWDRGRVVEWDGDGKPLRILGSHIDITHRKENEQRLARQARRDALTDLLNRQGLAHAFSETPSLAALLFIDLDDFKLVNDSLGHACGDRVLQQIAGWLRDIMPESAPCGRYGGDEFVVCLPEGVSPGPLAERLLAQVSDYLPDPGSRLTLGMSIGIARWEAERPPFRLALEAADRAMYLAKERGKQRWHQLYL